MGRIAAPLHRSGIEIVGVDAHPGMLAHLRRRVPGIESHEALIETLDLGRRFDLVIAPSGVLAPNASLAAAARHLRPGGRVGMELLNPHWLARGVHDGVRLRRRADGSKVLEVDYRRTDGATVVQVVERWRPGPAPERAGRRVRRFDLDLLWIGGRPDASLAESPTYYVLAGKP